MMDAVEIPAVDLHPISDKVKCLLFWECCWRNNHIKAISNLMNVGETFGCLGLANLLTMSAQWKP